MAYQVSNSTGHRVPKASATNAEQPVYPEVFSLATTEQTVPMATNHSNKVTIQVTATGAGSAEIWARPNDAATWFLLTALNFAADGGQSQMLESPTGQLKVVNNGLTTLIVHAMCTLNN